MTMKKFAGTWALDSFVARSENGEEFRPWGEHPAGRIIYTESGQMAVVMTQPDRPKFASALPFGGTPEEVRAAFENMEAYAGTFEVNEAEGLVTHHTAVCRMPNWEGTTQVRQFKLEGDRLSLTTPPVQIDGKNWRFTFAWHRV